MFFLSLGSSSNAFKIDWLSSCGELLGRIIMFPAFSTTAEYPQLDEHMTGSPLARASTSTIPAASSLAGWTSRSADLIQSAMLSDGPGILTRPESLCCSASLRYSVGESCPQAMSETRLFSI